MRRARWVAATSPPTERSPPTEHRAPSIGHWAPSTDLAALELVGLDLIREVREHNGAVLEVPWS